MDIKERIASISEDGELWKPCPEFETKYLISSHGRILGVGTYNTCKKGELIKQHKKKGRNGYMQVRLYDNGKAKTIETHVLVAKAFIPNLDNLPCINHKDEDKTNNHAENLEWCTNQYNIEYSHAMPVDVYTKEGEYIESFKSITRASNKYGIFGSNISRCCKSQYGICGNFQFRYKGQPFSPKPFTEYQRRKNRRGCDCNESRYVALYEYALDGTFVRIWKNSAEPAKEYGIAGANIRKCGKGEIFTIGGKIFLRQGENIEERLEKLKTRKHRSKSELLC